MRANPDAMPHLWEHYRELCRERMPMVVASFNGQPYDAERLEELEAELSELDWQIHRASGAQDRQEEIEAHIAHARDLIERMTGALS